MYRHTSPGIGVFEQPMLMIYDNLCAQSHSHTHYMNSGSEVAQPCYKHTVARDIQQMVACYRWTGAHDNLSPRL